MELRENYFNVLLISICVSLDVAKQIFLDGMNELWDIQGITDDFPWVVHIYVDDRTLSRDEEWSIMCIPHTAIQVGSDNKIQWYHMIDWDTKDPWDLEPFDEDLLD